MLFTIQGITPSQNEIDRMHWSTRSRLKDDWYWMVRGSMGMKSPVETEPVLLHIIRVGKRLIDDSNVPSGTKFLIDAMVHYGHAVDDSRRWMITTFDQRKCSKDEQPHMEAYLTCQTPSQTIRQIVRARVPKLRKPSQR